MSAFHEMSLFSPQHKSGQLPVLVTLFVCLLKAKQPMIFSVSKSEEIKMYWNLELTVRKQKIIKALKAILLSHTAGRECRFGAQPVC